MPDGIDPTLCVIASVSGSDRNEDGIDDPVVGVKQVGEGRLVAFFSDFFDWSSLEDPRECEPAWATCLRGVWDETLLLNAVCRPGNCVVGCGDCRALHRTIDEMMMDSEPLRQELHSKAALAREAEAAGELRKAAVLLRELLRDDPGAFSPGIDTASSIALAECIRDFAQQNSIPLLATDCGSSLGPNPLPRITRYRNPIPRGR